MRKAVLAVVVIVLSLLAGTASASTATYTVDSTTDAALKMGATGCESTEPTTADPSGTCTLRAAVQAADNAGGASTISLPAGTYQLALPPTTGDDPANGDLDVTNTGAVDAIAITITGAGSGPGPGATTIDANTTDRAFAVDSGASLALSGVTVNGGKPASTSSGHQDGGAIYADGALSLTGDVFSGNASPSVSMTAGGIGGAIYDDASTPGTPTALTVRNTKFTSNTADLQGGAIADIGTGVLTLTGDTFGGSGGAGNNGGEQGGAVYDSGSSAATIDDSTFVDNQAPTLGAMGRAYGGGSLWLGGNSYTLDRDELDGNVAGTLGGAVLWAGGALSSHGSSFVFNTTSAGNGGAIAGIGQGPLTLVNATVDSNTANQGGGLDLAPMPVDLVNDTLWNNAAETANGGNAWLIATGLTANTVGVQNTIIGHGGPGGATVTNPGDCTNGTSAAALPTDVDRGHNFNPDGTCLATTANGDQINNTALMLGSPANNGGPVLTDAEPAGAPTIDAGAAVNQSCPGADARGVARPQGNACDIGAYEFVPPPTPPATSTTTVISAPATTTVTTTGATPPPSAGTPPIATTRGVLGTRSTSAFLGGTVNAHNQATSYMFQAGTTRSYGLSTVTGHTDVGVLSVDMLIQRLKPGTLYHYRLVATNSAGTSYGADRTFRTAPAYDGVLKLASSTLTVHNGRVTVPLTCASTKACVLRFSITIAARLARTHKLGTLSFTRTTNSLVSLRAHRTTTVSAAVNPAALAVLSGASQHRLTGKFSTRPRTNQLGIISAVTLVLK